MDGDSKICEAHRYFIPLKPEEVSLARYKVSVALYDVVLGGARNVAIYTSGVAFSATQACCFVLRRSITSVV